MSSFLWYNCWLNLAKNISVMVGFEPRISGVRGNCSFHCATTEALWRYLSLCFGLGGVGLEGGRVISGQRGPRFDSGYLQTLPSKPAILNFVRKELWIKITRAMLLWRFKKPYLGPNKHTIIWAGDIKCLGLELCCDSLSVVTPTHPVCKLIDQFFCFLAEPQTTSFPGSNFA